MKLLIHVGMGKSGSSAIQTVCKDNQEILANHNCLYLGLMMNLNCNKLFDWQKASGWPQYLQLDKKRATTETVEIFKNILKSKIVKENNIETLIWSNESLFNNIDNLSETIKALSKLCEIQVVGFIRRPDQWITSAYFQWGVKHKSYKGQIKKFKDWVKTVSYSPKHYVDKWNSIIDNSFFYNYNTIDDVATFLIKIANDKIIESELQSSRIYKTPQKSLLALWYLYNTQFEEPIVPNELQKLITLYELNSTEYTNTGFNAIIPQETDIVQYIEVNRKNIDAINKYFSDTNQEQFELSEIAFKDFSINHNQINKVLLKTIKAMSDRIDRLENRLSKNGL